MTRRSQIQKLSCPMNSDAVKKKCKESGAMVDKRKKSGVVVDKGKRLVQG